MEPNIKPEPLPFPDRRNSVRRNEDTIKIQHTEAVEALLPELVHNARQALSRVRLQINGTKALTDEIEA